MFVKDMTAEQIRALPDPRERVNLARSEGKRIAEERGVPLVEEGSSESREAFGRWGVACSVESACGIFGVGPAGYFDESGNLRAVRVPVTLTDEDVCQIFAKREELARAKETTCST